MTAHLTSPDRVSHAQKAAAGAGIDALLVTPGPGPALADRLRRAAAGAADLPGPACRRASRSWWRPVSRCRRCWRRPVRDLDVEVVGWGETDDPYAADRRPAGTPAAGGAGQPDVGRAGAADARRPARRRAVPGVRT